jgi:hypothetical protein
VCVCNFQRLGRRFRGVISLQRAWIVAFDMLQRETQVEDMSGDYDSRAADLAHNMVVDSSTG